MKKILFLTLPLILLIIVSCEINDLDKNTPVNSNPQRLIVISNVESVSQNDGNRALCEGSKIKGVLLKFHSDGPEANSEFKLDNPNAFYIEELKSTLKDKNSMEYNYVIYVPDCIRTSYYEGGGANSESGNPLWWFLSSYYGEELSETRGNWNEVIELLLKNKDNIIYPNKEKVNNNWKATPKGESNSQTFYRLEPRRYTYDPINDTSYSGDNTYNKEFGYYHIIGENKNLHLLLYPNDIYLTYILNGGMGIDSPDNAYREAFYWYLYVYYSVTQADVAEMIDNNTYLDFVEKLNIDLKNGKKANPKDIPEGQKQIVYNTIPDSLPTDTIELRNVYAYQDGNLIFEDGTPITNLEKLYCVVEDWSHNGKTRIVIYIYMPKSLIQQFEIEHYKWNGENQPFYDYLKSKGLPFDNYRIPVETLEKLFSDL